MLRHRNMQRDSVPNMVTRLVRIYRNAGDTSEAVVWYGNAQNVAKDLAAGSPYTVRQCAAVIAVLSPRITWAQNVIAARTVVDSHAQGVPVESVKVSGFGRNVREAYAILDGKPFVGGPKTGAFYRAIMGDDDSVTVDVWAYRAATGRDCPNGVPAKEHGAIDAAYRQAARRLSLSPRELQSIVWVAVRGSHA